MTGHYLSFASHELPKLFFPTFMTPTKHSLTVGFLLSAIILTMPTFSNAQGVVIGAGTPNPAAALDVNSSAKGFLPPRMPQSSRDLINPAATAAGLLIFNTDSKQLNLWDGIRWVLVNSGFETSSGFQSQIGSPFTRTYALNTLDKTYNVPTGVNYIQVQATGASGIASSTPGSVPRGGYGAQVTAILQVTPGEQLTITIGSQGVTLNTYSSGGGATDLRRATANGGTGDVISSRNALLVAGGGGGAGQGGNGPADATGGHGGGLLLGAAITNYGNANGSGKAGGPSGTGGSGGTAGLGEYGGGQGNAGFDVTSNPPISGGKGGGGGGVGSVGGVGNCTTVNYGNPGGGGGGGYYSGGAGCSASGDGSRVSGGGGGGGGSSWVSLTARASSGPTPVFNVSQSFGDGQLTITPVE